MKKYKDYVLLLLIFLGILFRGSFNKLMIWVNPHLNDERICQNYDESSQNKLENLEEMLEINTVSNDLIVTKVKYRNIYDYKKTLNIYKGFKNGVTVGSAVFSKDGLVGQVIKTYDYYSLVELVTNKDSNISVRINDSIGILKWLNDKMVVTNLTGSDVINENDSIVTSGLGVIPENIYVGKVKSINYSKTELERTVEVELGVNLNNIDYLYVWGISND